MSNIQLFSNNAKTTLAAQLLVGGTTFTVAASGGALFRTIASPNYELITLQRESDGAIEIIRVTTHTAANDVFAVIARAQESTSALQFEIGDKVQARWTRGSAEAVTQGVPFTGTPGTASIDMQSARSDPATIGVTGNNSVGIGDEVLIAGNNSVGVGRNVTVAGSGSVAIGSTVDAAGSGSVALGQGADASGDSAIAIGDGIEASGNLSIALGGSNFQVDGYRAIGIGWDGGVFGNYAIAIGNGKFNAGESSVSIGNYGTAAYSYGVTLGAFAYATGSGGTAIGAQSSAGSYRVAVGYSASAGGTAATAVGSQAIANGSSSVAIGADSNITGDYVTSVGNANICSGNQSTLLGYRIQIGAANYAVAVGYFSGGGYKTTAVGVFSEVQDDYSTAVGFAADAGGPGAVSIGYQSQAYADYAVAIGFRAETYSGSIGAIAIGYNAGVNNGDYALAIGYNALVGSGFHYAIAIGFEAQPGALSVAHIAAPIVNVADHAGVAFGDAGERLRGFAGVEVVLMSKSYDLTDATPFDGGTLGTKDFWVMPAGAKFYPDEVGIVTDAQNTVTTGPTASFGHGGAGTEILNNQLFASGVLGQSGGRGQYASAAPEGVGTVSIAMNGAATATALNGRFFVRGMMVENVS